MKRRDFLKIINLCLCLNTTSRYLQVSLQTIYFKDCKIVLTYIILPPGPFLKHMREHKSRWSHSWSLLLYGYVHCTTYPGFSTTLTNCVFQGRKQILSNSSRQTQSKNKKRKRNETFDFIFFNYEHYFASKFKRFTKRFDGKNLKIRIRRVHFQIQKSSKIFLYILILIWLSKFKWFTKRFEWRKKKLGASWHLMIFRVLVQWKVFSCSGIFYQKDNFATLNRHFFPIMISRDF